jgi:hypothetical protein
MLGMRDDIGFAKELLEKNGYVVARLGIDGWIDAVRFGDDYVAFRLQSTWKQGRTGLWVTPKRFSELLGIDRHTLTRKLKQKNCPGGISRIRGPKGS